MPAHVERPRLVRSVLLQAVAIAASALASERPWAKREARPEPPPPPKREERRIRVVKLTPPKPPPATAKPPPAAAQASPPPARSAPQPAPAASAHATRAPAPKALAHIAADSTALHGVRLRVLVPRGPVELAAHLRNSGGCLVVSRLSGAGAEVVSVLGLEGSRAVELSSPPCSGVPRLLRDSLLNQAIGDPLGRARLAMPGEDLVLQVLLTPRLQVAAQSALQSRFGAVSEEEMSRRAAEAGYQLTCFAEPEGNVRCE